MTLLEEGTSETLSMEITADLGPEPSALTLKEDKERKGEGTGALIPSHWLSRSSKIPPGVGGTYS